MDDHTSNRDFTAIDVTKLLTGPARAAKVTVLESVDSTNNALKRRADEGGAHGEVLIARQQTAGKGRLGKSFYSPKGTGLYISVLLRPDVPASQVLSITTAAAVAVAQTVDELTGERAKIKWVNDVYLRGYKVCGILAEAASAFRGDRLRCAVLGIGVNITPPPGGFPEDIRNVAGALFESAPPEDAVCRLAAGILNRFFALYQALPDAAYLEEYRSRSLLDDLEITFTFGNQRFTGRVMGIDDTARLNIRLPNGEVKAFASGEVAIEKDFLEELRRREAR